MLVRFFENIEKIGLYIVCILGKSGLYLVCNADFFLYRPVSSLHYLLYILQTALYFTDEAFYRLPCEILCLDVTFLESSYLSFQTLQTHNLQTRCHAVWHLEKIWDAMETTFHPSEKWKILTIDTRDNFHDKNHFCILKN